MRTKEKSENLKYLESLPKGTTLYTVLRHVSSSGMTRAIDLFTIDTDDKHGSPLRFLGIPESTHATKSMEAQDRNHGAYYRLQGCGMDMGFHLVYGLGQLVHGDGYWFHHKWI